MSNKPSKQLADPAALVVCLVCTELPNTHTHTWNWELKKLQQSRMLWCVFMVCLNDVVWAPVKPSFLACRNAVSAGFQVLLVTPGIPSRATGHECYLTRPSMQSRCACVTHLYTLDMIWLQKLMFPYKHSMLIFLNIPRNFVCISQWMWYATSMPHPITKQTFSLRRVHSSLCINLLLRCSTCPHFQQTYLSHYKTHLCWILTPPSMPTFYWCLLWCSTNTSPTTKGNFC